MNTKLAMLFILIGSIFLNISLADEFIYKFSAEEEARIDRMIELAEAGDAAILDLTIGEMNELDCHVTPNGNWLKCDWPYSPNLCAQAGWIPHHDGSCCKRINYTPPPSISFRNSRP